MGREYRILSRLCRVYEPAPCPLLFCDDEGVLGAPFYLMERRHGVILRKPPPADRPMPPETVRRLCESLIDGLARLHSLDYQAAGLGDLGKPEGYVERQVSGWSRRYRDAQTDDVPGLDRAADWLAANRPAESGAALIHNDYKFDNLVLDPDDPGRIVAVLDWEMATIGDPLMDLGTTLGYWIEPTDPVPLRRFLAGPTALPGSLTRRELGLRYCEAVGRDGPRPAVLSRLWAVQDRRDRPADLRPIRPAAPPRTHDSLRSAASWRRSANRPAGPSIPEGPERMPGNSSREALSRAPRAPDRPAHALDGPCVPRPGEEA